MNNNQYKLKIYLNNIYSESYPINPNKEAEKAFINDIFNQLKFELKQKPILQKIIKPIIAKSIKMKSKNEIYNFIFRELLNIYDDKKSVKTIAKKISAILDENKK